MQPDIGPEEMAIINTEAKRFKRNPVFSGYSSEDIAQDMALFVRKWAWKYDPARAHWHAFIKVYARACGNNLIDKRSSLDPDVKHLKQRIRSAVSLDKTLGLDEAGEPLTAADIIPDRRPAVADEVAFSIDFAEALSSLPEEIRLAARLLTSHTINEVAAELKMPVTTFRRRVLEPLQTALAPFRESYASA